MPTRIEGMSVRRQHLVPGAEHDAHEWHRARVTYLDELAEAELSRREPGQDREALVRRLGQLDRPLGGLDVRSSGPARVPRRHRRSAQPPMGSDSCRRSRRGPGARRSGALRRPVRIMRTASSRDAGGATVALQGRAEREQLRARRPTAPSWPSRDARSAPASRGAIGARPTGSRAARAPSRATPRPWSRRTASR